MHMFFIVPACSLIALGWAVFLALNILKKDEGTDKMKEIAEAVREGAGAYLTRQYKNSSIFFVIVFAILLILASQGYFVKFVPFAFLTGGLFSGLAGFCGMKIATHASARTANACRTSLNGGLRIAFASGTVMGLSVVGLGLLGLSGWYLILDHYYPSMVDVAGIGVVNKLVPITSTLLCFGMGASFQALYARVGGGIFTKAADVGADLVGKVEANIPEDDPRNPAVIADNVGDNVGDVAGMGADLYESYVGSIAATATLGVAAGLGFLGLFVPMAIAAIGILSSIIGTFFVRTEEKVGQKALLMALRKGIFVASGVLAAGSFIFIKVIWQGDHSGIFFSIMTGLIAGILIGLSTEFFTSAEYKPTRTLAKTAVTGTGPFIIDGIALGMMSTSLPIIIIVGAIIGSFYFSGGFDQFALGLYGIGIAAVGMLSTLGITLATDAYGPVADNAGGNAQMAKLGEEVRKRTDALDSLGNTTAATGKGFAIGSAALTALALIATFKENVEVSGGQLNLNLMDPIVLGGLFIGAMLPFAFSALTMGAVGRAAGMVVLEVRRQFKEIQGIMDGTGKPDYARCVSIVTAQAQKEMIMPAVLAVVSPIAVGLLLGVNALGGMLIGATVAGFTLAVFMANAGGAWDNAKKFIESGQHGGKGSEAHKSGVVGDTVGDPFKDTAGPSINILIKLMSMVSIFFAAFIMSNSIIG